MELGEGPHDRLHIGQVHGLVVVAEVDPAGLAGDRVLPLLRVADNRLAAALVELGYAEGLDGGPAGHPQLALGLHLGRQPVAVPPEAPVHPVAPHGLVPGHDILDVAGEQVAVVGEPVGERRAVVEDPVPFGGPGSHRLLEGPLGLPASQDPALDGREVGAADLGIRLATAFSHGRSGYLSTPPVQAWRSGRRVLSSSQMTDTGFALFVGHLTRRHPPAWPSRPLHPCLSTLPPHGS